MATADILIVDDDLDLAEGLAEVLQLEGHATEIVSNGRTALERCRLKAFDLILMDVRMPVMNGVDSFLEIRKIRPDAKVMMMTGHQEPIVARALEAGALGLLRKPFTVDALLGALQSTARPLALVGDEDASFVGTLRQQLATSGYAAAVVESGEEAVACVRDGGVDILLMDLKLPVSYGLEVYDDLAKRGNAPSTIIVTTKATERWDTIDVLRQISASEYLTKPVDPDLLVALVEWIVAADR
jgi:two-component system, NtrC family, response regulator HydG